MSAETQQLSTRKAVPAAFLRWGGVWVMAAVLVGVLLANDARLDTWAWRATRWAMGSNQEKGYDWEQAKQAATQTAAGGGVMTMSNSDARTAGRGVESFEMKTPPLSGKLYKKTETLWRVLRALGEPWMMLIAAGVVAIYDRRRWRAGLMMVASAAVAGGLVSLLSATLGRLRPDGKITEMLRNDGQNLWTLGRGFTGHGDLSFPSGHATLAFAVAAVLVYLSPRGRWLFLMLAGGCALSRVVLHAHFYSDVIAGGTLGYTLAWLMAWGMDRLGPGKGSGQLK